MKMKIAIAAALILAGYWVYAVYRDRSDSVVVRLADGTPIQDATVSIMSLNSPFVRVEALSDGEGKATFPGDHWNRESWVSVKITKGDAVVFDKVVGAPRFGPIRITTEKVRAEPVEDPPKPQP